MIVVLAAAYFSSREKRGGRRNPSRPLPPTFFHLSSPLLGFCSGRRVGRSGKRMAINSSTPSQSPSPGILLEYGGGLGLEEPFLRHNGHAVRSCNEVEAQQRSRDGATFFRTCVNGLNALSGVGIVSIPYALSEGGWLSLGLLFMVAMMCWYTGLLLQRCMNADPSIKDYPDIGELAFGYKGRLFVSVFMYLELYLVAIEFLILEGDNLDKLFPDVSLNIGSLSIARKQLFVILVAFIILPTTWLRSLGALAYVSAGGVLASVIVVLSVFWAATFDGVGFNERGRLLNIKGLPTALGLYAFCYCGHAVFPTLCTSMKDKTKFPMVLLICFVLCTINYGSMAIFGYLMYGENVKSQVTLNLPINKLCSKVAIYTTLINPFSKFALLITPIATIIEERLLVQDNRPVTVLIRTLLVLSTMVLALAIPFFGYLMALIGSLLSVIVSLLLPCICYLKIFKASQRCTVELAIILGIMVISCLIAIIGTYSSLHQIIHEYSKSGNRC